MGPVCTSAHQVASPWQGPRCPPEQHAGRTGRRPHRCVGPTARPLASGEGCRDELRPAQTHPKPTTACWPGPAQPPASGTSRKPRGPGPQRRGKALPAGRSGESGHVPKPGLSGRRVAAGGSMAGREGERAERSRDGAGEPRSGDTGIWAPVSRPRRTAPRPSPDPPWTPRMRAPAARTQGPAAPAPAQGWVPLEGAAGAQPARPGRWGGRGRLCAPACRPRRPRAPTGSSGHP